MDPKASLDSVERIISFVCQESTSGTFCPPTRNLITMGTALITNEQINRTSYKPQFLATDAEVPGSITVRYNIF
jgi:hypothetical protein